MAVFEYGEDATIHLKKRDKALGRAIDAIGPLRREIHDDLFAALVNSIVGQQISSKAQKTIWGRIKAGLGEVTPQTILACTETDLQRYGISFRK